jgi:hypothetical protein
MGKNTTHYEGLDPMKLVIDTNRIMAGLLEGFNLPKNYPARLLLFLCPGLY